MEGGRRKDSYEDRVALCPTSTAPAANGTGNEAMDEEAQIEEFFELMRRIQEMRKELRTRNASPAGRGRGMDHQGRQPWMPVFEMEDFGVQAKEAKTVPEEGNGGGGGGRGVGDKGKKRRRTQEEEDNEGRRLVSTSLNLRLGL